VAPTQEFDIAVARVMEGERQGADFLSLPRVPGARSTASAGMISGQDPRVTAGWH
jgi:hypothetical protein